MVRYSYSNSLISTAHSKNFLRLLLLLPLGFLSCGEEDGKEDDPAPKLSPQETILISHKWNLVAHKYIAPDGEVITDAKITDACLQDDAYTFKEDGTWSFDPGIQCDMNVKPYGGTWKIVGNIFISTRSPSTQAYEEEIKELTDSTFVYGHDYNGHKITSSYRAL